MKKLKTSQKRLLIFASANLVIGIFVTLTHAMVSPVWAVVLPVGVVCLGLFLLSCIWHGEMLKFDEDERLRIESAVLRSAPTATNARKPKPKSGKPFRLDAAEAGVSPSAARNSTKSPLRTASREIT